MRPVFRIVDMTEAHSPVCGSTRGGGGGLTLTSIGHHGPADNGYGYRQQSGIQRRGRIQHYLSHEIKLSEKEQQYEAKEDRSDLGRVGGMSLSHLSICSPQTADSYGDGYEQAYSPDHKQVHVIDHLPPPIS